MATITYNEKQPFDYIYPTTSGGTVFGTNKAASAVFNYFDNAAVVNDAIYFGMSFALSFSDIEFVIGTGVAAATWAVAWERWTGSAWVAVPGLTDNTNGFQNTGTLTVTFPMFQAANKVVNGSSYVNWIRCRITTVTGITNGGANATTSVKNRNGAITISSSGVPISTFNAAIYAADVAGGWGVCTKQGSFQYAYNCHLFVGYAADAAITTLTDIDVDITIKGMICAKKSGSIIRLGNLVTDAPLYITDHGCHITNSKEYHSYWADGTGQERWIFYSCICNFTPYTVTKAYNTLLGRAYHTSGIIIYNCSYTNSPDWTGNSQSSGASVDQVLIMGSFNGIRQEFSDYLRNFKIVGATYSGYVGSGATNNDYDNTTIDMISDGTGIYWQATPTDARGRGIYISRQNTVNLTVKASGVAVQNANITLLDTNGYNAAYKQVGYCNGFLYTQTTITMLANIYSLGDVVRVGSEKLSLDSGTYPTYNTTRALEGTVASQSSSTQKIVQKCYPIVQTDANGLSGEILVESSLEKWSSGTLPGVTSFTYRSPFTLSVKKYGYLDISQTMNIQGTSTTSGAVNSSIGLIVDPIIVKSEAAASAITGITINHSTQTVTITANTTIRDLYDYIHWNINQSTNPFYATPMTSADGVNFTLAYNLVLNGGNLTGTGNLSLGAKTLTVTAGETTTVPITYSSGSAVYGNITIAGLVANSRVRVNNTTDNIELYNAIVAETSLSIPATWTANKVLDLRVTNVIGTTAYLPYQASGTLTSSMTSFTVTQKLDVVYNANAIDGSTITYFSTDYPNLQVDISSGTTFDVQEMYAWYQYASDTSQGIVYYFNGITAQDTVNYVINTAVIDLDLDNTSGHNILMINGYLSKDDGTSYIYASTANSIIPVYDRAYTANSDSIDRKLNTIIGEVL